MWSASTNLSTSAIDLTRTRSHIDLRGRGISHRDLQKSSSTELNHRLSEGHRLSRPYEYPQNYKILDTHDEEPQDYYATCGYSGSAQKKVILLLFFAVVATIGCLIGLVSVYVPPRASQGTHESGSTGRSQYTGNWLSQPCEKLTTCSDPDNMQTIVLALPGLNDKMFEKVKMSSLEKLGECGSSVTRLRPVYPAESVPNAYTVATGVYPSIHGIVSENFQTRTGQDFNSNDKLVAKSPTWWKTSPIWTILEETTNKKAAVFNWPGGKAHEPEHYSDPTEDTYGIKYRNEARDWLFELEGQEKSPELIMVYIRDLLTSLIKNGTSDVTRALTNSDRELTDIIQHLYSKGHLGCINLIIVSEAGLGECGTDMTKKQNIHHHIKTVLDEEEYTFWRHDNQYGVTAIGVYMSEEMTKEKELELTEKFIESMDNNVAVYSRSNRPAHWHFEQNTRIPHFIFQARKEPTNVEMECKGLQSGYDPKEDDMAGVMFAMGPRINTGTIQEETSSLEIHGLLRELLEITDSATDTGGNYTKNSLAHIIRNYDSTATGIQSNKMPQLETTCKKGYEKVACSQVNEICRDSNDFNEWILSLDTIEATRTLYDRHTFFGETKIMAPNQFCLLVQEDTMTAYSMQKRMPIYVSYITNRTSIVNDETESIIPPCHYFDPRAMDTTSCPSWEEETNKGDTQRVPLYVERDGTNPDTDDFYYPTTNSVPMYNAYHWKFVELLENNMIRAHGEIYSINGPIFDHDYNGIADIMDENTENILPTHYFKVENFFRVIMYCAEKQKKIQSCRQGAIVVHAFVLPHVEMVGNRNGFLAVSQYVASLRDVELASGLQFIPLVTHPLYYTNTKIALDAHDDIEE